jgi:hypothetical protein
MKWRSLVRIPPPHLHGQAKKKKKRLDIQVDDLYFTSLEVGSSFYYLLFIIIIIYLFHFFCLTCREKLT